MITRRGEVLELLQARMPELRQRFRVGSLALFGSYARDEAGANSDVDLLVEFAEVPNWATVNRLIDFLESLFGRLVDLASPSKLKPRMRLHVERELIRVV